MGLDGTPQNKPVLAFIFTGVAFAGHGGERGQRERDTKSRKAPT
jgi:hypothetical protein